MKKKITLILFILMTLLVIQNKVKAEETTKNLVNIYFFHSDSCAHCKEESKLLEKLQQRYANIKIYKYEIHDKQNDELLEQARDLYDIKTKGVPITIIGDKAYEGFSFEKSNLKFIKTIEYYSRYGYNDKLGKYLKVELSTYNINENDITLDEFIDNYHNYNLLGLKTDNLDTSSIAIILGLLSSFNITMIISVILVVLMVHKIKEEKKKILLLTFYILLQSLLLIITLINNKSLSTIIYIILLVIFVINVIKILQKKQQCLSLNIVIIISFLTNYVITNFDNTHITVFINILNLYNLSGLTKLTYYSNYIIINLILNIFLLYIGYIIVQLVSKKI